MMAACNGTVGVVEVVWSDVGSLDGLDDGLSLDGS
jgi:hypothetical protein